MHSSSLKAMMYCRVEIFSSGKLWHIQETSIATTQFYKCYNFWVTHTLLILSKMASSVYIEVLQAHNNRIILLQQD